MKLHLKRIFFRTLKIMGISIVLVIGLLIALPMLFPNSINRKINSWVNNNINGHISFTRTGLSILKHFPSLTLTLYDVTLKGSAPFENDTLISAEDLALGIDLSSLFKSKITINKIILKNAFINIQVDSMGHANYNVYKQKQGDSTVASSSDTSGASLGINKIVIKNSRVVYNDQSLPMTIVARGLNYTGSGDLGKDIFQLTTHAKIESFDFYYAHQPYIINKKVNADLVTEINTKSLAFIFQKNELFVNQLPVEFKGSFGFIKDGYDMDFNFESKDNDLDEIVSALPLNDEELLAKTQIDGSAYIQLSLTGKYIASQNKMPDLSLKVNVRDGYIKNKLSPVPVSKLYIDLDAKIPGCNPDSLALNLDSLYFKLDDGYFRSKVKIKGINAPEIYARINSEIDLEKWHKAIGLAPFEMKGMYTMHLMAEGRYDRVVESKGKKKDTVFRSIPKFSLRSTFRNGYFKYAHLPQAIDHISFDLQASCADSNYKHIQMAVDSLDIRALDNYIKGYVSVGNIVNFPVNADIRAKIHLHDLKKFYPADTFADVAGDLDADIKANGNLDLAHKIYPVLTANISLQNGTVKTKYYPHPVKDIQVSTTITDSTGDLKGLHVAVNPVSFTFEDEPFLLKADLRDFTDISYKVFMKGTLNLGNIYQVFAIKGYNVTGTVAAKLSLKGKQSDAEAGRYDLLQNKGTLRVNNITCKTSLYPMPFVISTGAFHFNQGHLELDTMTVQYNNSEFVLNGSVYNAINYFIKPGSVLTGDLNLTSDLLVVDDFMSTVPDSGAPAQVAAPAQQSSSNTGVVMIPGNLDLTFSAKVGKVRYNDVELTNLDGQVVIRDDSILLQNTGFSIIGTTVTMDGAYTGINPNKAYFDYNISAKDFDIQKAYKGIKMFRVMASSAEHAEGLISLDYHINGYLDGNMMPVYPSLKGGGVVSAEKLSMHGFRLFDAIGRETKQDSISEHSSLSKIEIKTNIANNILTLEKTKIKVSGFRLKMEGQASFNKELNFKFRLGLPPHGLVGIPMTITGTQDNPKIQMKRGKDNEVLQETDSTEAATD